MFFWLRAGLLALLGAVALIGIVLSVGDIRRGRIDRRRHPMPSLSYDPFKGLYENRLYVTLHSAGVIVGLVFVISLIARMVFPS